MKKVVSAVLALSFAVGTVAVSVAPANAKGRECSGHADGNPCKKNR